MDALPDRMLVARHSRRLTQEQLARELEISQAHYCKVERGDARPSPELAFRIEQWLKRTKVPKRARGDRRALELARLIQRHSRELARLVRK